MPTHNITPAYQLELLTRFTNFLKGLDYDAELLETEIGDSRSYSTQYVVLNISSNLLPGENYLRVESAFLPQADKDSGNHSILQTMVPIVMVDEKADLHEVYTLVVKLNTFLPLGSFGYWEEQNMVYYKQNNTIANKNNEHVYACLEEQLVMIQHLLTNFVPSIAAVAIDGSPAKTALEQNPFAQAFL